MIAPIKQDSRPVAFDPTSYQKRGYDVSYTQLARQVLDNQKPTNDNQWASGYLLICLTLLIALKMYFGYKNESPSAKKEKALKYKLVDEVELFGDKLSQLKDDFNDKMLKRERFEDVRHNCLTLEVNTVKSDTEHNKESIHEIRKELNDKFGQIIQLLRDIKTP